MNTSISLAVFVRILLDNLQPTVLVVLDPTVVGVHPLCAQIVEAVYQNANTLNYSYVQVLGLGLSNNNIRGGCKWMYNLSRDERRSARLQLRSILAGEMRLVLCIHMLMSARVGIKLGTDNTFESTKLMLEAFFAQPLHLYQHVLLTDRSSLNMMRTILHVRTQLPLAYVTVLNAVTNRVESVVRALDAPHQWLGTDFEAALHKYGHIWRYNK